MSVKSTLIDKPAQDFSADFLQGDPSLTLLDGQRIQLGDLKGRPVVLNFWASWCVSCRQEARYFETFWQSHKDKGVMVVGVAIQDTPEAAKDFAKVYGKTYPLALDTSGKAGIDYGVYGVPETFFIDKNGVVRHKETGPMSIALLEEKLKLIM
jgi:cytochrome c biogenesis protein CcmG/thiol:disulfide interchange protein DsbE